MLSDGCKIGFTGSQASYSYPNLRSAFDHADIVSDLLAQECAQGFMEGPFQSPPFANFKCSGLGVVPKMNGAWRLIHHLSAPFGQSVNDGIDKDSYSLHYSSVDDAIKLCLDNRPAPFMVKVDLKNAFRQVPAAPFMVKVDLKNAFRQVPVHPDDQWLLGCEWNNGYYYHTRLPFGLRSSPYLFNRVADSLQWVLEDRGVTSLIHYLDDFLAVSPTLSTGLQCRQVMLDTMDFLGVGWAPEKVVGPSQKMVFWVSRLIRQRSVYAFRRTNTLCYVKIWPDGCI